MEITNENFKVTKFPNETSKLKLRMERETTLG